MDLAELQYMSIYVCVNLDDSASGISGPSNEDFFILEFSYTYYPLEAEWQVINQLPPESLVRD